MKKVETASYWVILAILTLVSLFWSDVSEKIQAASMTEQQATAAAQQIWGNIGFARKAGRNYQIVCTYSGRAIVAGTSKSSFDEALASVSLQANGYHVLTAVARATDGETATSQPVTVLLCNGQ